MWFDWYLSYLLPYYAVSWDYIRIYPEQALLWLIICVIVIWFVITVIFQRKEAQRLRLRGSKMSRNARKKWLQKHCADTIYSAFEKELDAGHISQSEFTSLIRMAKSRVGLPDLANRKKWGDVEHITPSKATTTREHLSAVKDGIALRLTWGIRNWFYKPVKIPGPKPGEDVKAKPLRKRGVLLARRPQVAA